ncbi:MAG: response regulator, partial [bacterium]
MTSIRTLLVDDNCEFLTSCKRFLSKFPEIEVVGYANSGYEALQQLNLLKPDLVLLDIIMPKMNGLEATRRIKSQSKSTRVVILT